MAKPMGLRTISWCVISSHSLRRLLGSINLSFTSCPTLWKFLTNPEENPSVLILFTSMDFWKHKSGTSLSTRDREAQGLEWEEEREEHHASPSDKTLCLPHVLT